MYLIRIHIKSSNLECKSKSLQVTNQSTSPQLDFHRSIMASDNYRTLEPASPEKDQEFIILVQYHLNSHSSVEVPFKILDPKSSYQFKYQIWHQRVQIPKDSYHVRQMVLDEIDIESIVKSKGKMKALGDPDDPLQTQGDKILIYSFTDYEGVINKYQARQYFVFEAAAGLIEEIGFDVCY